MRDECEYAPGDKVKIMFDNGSVLIGVLECGADDDLPIDLGGGVTVPVRTEGDLYPGIREMRPWNWADEREQVNPSDDLEQTKRGFRFNVPDRPGVFVDKNGELVEITGDGDAYDLTWRGEYASPEFTPESQLAERGPFRRVRFLVARDR